MQTVRFVKDPGYIYDLFFLFALHYNKDFCLTNLINSKNATEDTAFINRLYLDYEDIPEDLLPFFYIRDKNKCFMTQHYFEPYSSGFITDYQLSMIQNELMNYDQVIDQMIAFYFPDTDREMRQACKESPVLIGRLIKDSSYTSRIKSSLYSFFLEPIPSIQLLSKELMEKGFRLSRLYDQNIKKIEQLQNKVDFWELKEKLKLFQNNTIDIESFSDIYISFCIANKNCVKTTYVANYVIIFLGTDYQNSINSLISQNIDPNLNTFGTAVSEKNRLDILELMFRKKEITIRDIEQGLGFTGTNAYYHVSLMIKAGMVKTRNKGRTVLYSLNQEYFHRIANMISKYGD